MALTCGNVAEHSKDCDAIKAIIDLPDMASPDRGISGSEFGFDNLSRSITRRVMVCRSKRIGSCGAVAALDDCATSMQFG